jgi:hypothetical protein
MVRLCHYLGVQARDVENSIAMPHMGQKKEAVTKICNFPFRVRKFRGLNLKRYRLPVPNFS